MNLADSKWNLPTLPDNKYNREGSVWTYRWDVFQFHVFDQGHAQKLAFDKEVKLHMFVDL